MHINRAVLPILAGIITAFPASRTAAQARYPVKWAPKPALHAIPDSFKKISAAFILEERQVEISEGKDGDYELYRTIHRIIRLMDDKGVEAFNTFSIPIGRDRKLTDIQARTILPDGRVIEVSRDKIREVKNEDGEPEYRVAMEGVERGAEVEILYTEQRGVSTFGTELYQFGIPAMKGVFRLLTPERLRFDSKGYNGFPSLTDSVAGSRHFYTAIRDGIPALEDETYSLYRPSLQRLDYKLSYVEGDESNVRLQTWTDFAKQLYKIYYTYTDKEQKAAEKLLDKIGVKKDEPALKKVLAIEDYFKTEIVISDELSDENAGEFSRIAEKKTATEKDYMRFFAACLSAAGIRHELGLMANRYGYPMDERLEIWNHLDIYAVYLPDERSFLAPTAVTFRYPFVPYLMCGAKGLFTRTTTLGTMVSALPDIKTIPHTSMEKNDNAITADVSFKDADMVPAVTITHSFYGYSSSGLREAFLYGPKDKEKELVQGISGLAEKAADIQSYKVENAAFTNFTAGKPLVLTAVLQSPKLMEKAGPKYLFKVGELIGRQVEMYQDEHRSLPIEVEYPHSLPRTLRIRIPDGYKVVNPEAVRIKELFNEGGKDIAGFVSDYKMEGNELVVSINEFYGQTSYPISRYETFRKVINAAADFNKVVLVLQKG
jgi:hypothetical protein